MSPGDTTRVDESSTQVSAPNGGEKPFPAHRFFGGNGMWAKHALGMGVMKHNIPIPTTNPIVHR